MHVMHGPYVKGVPPLILGLILGPLAERFVVTTMVSESNDWTVFFSRPISAVLIAISAAMLVWSLTQQLSRSARKSALLG